MVVDPVEFTVNGNCWYLTEDHFISITEIHWLL